MKKSIFFVLFFILIIKSSIFASSYLVKTSGSYISSEQIFTEVNLNLISNNITFTQDENYIYYSINQILQTPDLRKYNVVNYIGSNPINVLISNNNQMANFYIDIYQTSTVNTNKSTYSYNGNIIYSANNGIQNTYQTFFLDKVYAKNGEIIDSDAISCSRSYTYTYITLNYNNIRYNVTSSVKIKKKYIDKFRYLTFLFPCCLAYSSTASSDNIWSASCKSMVDLKSIYDNHIHDFVLKYQDEFEHEFYCDGCKWTRKENHNFDLIYDNIENAKCECGKIKKVRLTYTSNLSDDCVYIATVNEANPYYDIIKEGYSLNNFIDYKLVNDEFVVATISNTVKLYERVPKESHKYYFSYSPHKYYVNFCHDNKYNLKFSNIMEKQEFTYNKLEKLHKNIYIKKGYIFSGWSMKPDIDKVMFIDEDNIINLTNEDNYVLNFYPVFCPYMYEVKYITKSRVETIKYTYGENKKINKTITDGLPDYVFTDWTIDGKKIKIKSTNDLENLIYTNNQTITLIADYYLNVRGEIANENDNAPGKIDINIEPFVNNDSGDIYNNENTYNNDNVLKKINNKTIDKKNSNKYKIIKNNDDIDDKKIKNNSNLDKKIKISYLKWYYLKYRDKYKNVYITNISTASTIKYYENISNTILENKILLLNISFFSLLFVFVILMFYYLLIMIILLKKSDKDDNKK